MKPIYKFGVIPVALILTAAIAAVTTLYFRGVDYACATEMLKNIQNEELRSWSCLHYAAASGDTARMEALLDKAAKLEARSLSGKTPLYEAAKRGRTKAVKLLTEHGADLSAKSEHPGFTPLHVAAEYNHFHTVRFLLSQKLDIEVQNAWRQTPLAQAAWRLADVKMIALLLKHGADINTQDNNGFSPLHRAAGKQRLEIMKFLIDKEEDINIKTAKGTTPLMYSAYKGSIDAVKLLLEADAEVEKRPGKKSALRLAKKAGHEEIVTLLKSAGAIDTLLISHKLKSGHAHYENNALPESLADLDLVLEEDPQNAQALYYRGRTYQKMKQTDQALNDLLASLELDPDNLEALEVVGWLYLTQKNYDKSIEYYTKVIKLDSQNVKAYHNRAGLYVQLGEMEKAFADIDTACGKGYKDACRMKIDLANH